MGARESWAGGGDSGEHGAGRRAHYKVVPGCL